MAAENKLVIKQTDKAIAKWQHREKSWHIIRIILMLASSVVIIAYIAYAANQSIKAVLEDNIRTRKYIGCVVDAFTTQNPKAALEVCRKSQS